MVRVWLDAFFSCHNLTAAGVERIDYPDGGPYLDQEQCLLGVFALIKDQVLFELGEMNGK